ncbi:MAG: hypothetical protein HYU66_12320 [Armatimonadetes bacterium]|nr:hypothetical protein [Armatimonadota bacterium]
MGRVVVALLIATAAVAAPSARVEGDRVVVRSGEQTLAVSLADARLTFSSPAGDATFTVSLQAGAGWTQPERVLDPPRIRRGGDAVRVDLAWPVSEQRRFAVEVDAFDRVPALFVTSRLTVLTGPRAQYYYWQSDMHPAEYAAAGVLRRAFDLTAWDPLAQRNWWWLPGPRGGVALLPTNCGGRSPGEGGAVFLHALPRSELLAPGEAQVATFAVAGAADAVAAAAVHAAAVKRWPAGLDPGRAAEPDIETYGRPAPAWLRTADCYNLYYHPAAAWNDSVVDQQLRGIPFIIGSTPDKAALDRCHHAGVKLLHYVVYTCLLDTALQVREGGQVYSEWSESLDCETRDLKDHPDWICIAPDGAVQHDAWGQEHGHRGLLNTCLHQPGLHATAVRQVRRLMELGYDGVFIDLAGPVPECHGPQHGKHAHADGLATNTAAYEQLLGEIYRAVKRFGDDRVVIQNTCTGILTSHWPACDAQMLEAFPYGAESAELRANASELAWWSARLSDAVAHGKTPVLLPYLGPAHGGRLTDTVLFSYVYARLNGFLWADGFTAGAPLGPLVNQCRLGRPLEPRRALGAAQYRRFERGVVVANPTDQPLAVTVPVGADAPLRDLGHDRVLTPERGRVTLELAPESGRVLVR